MIAGIKAAVQAALISAGIPAARVSPSASAASAHAGLLQAWLDDLDETAEVQLRAVRRGLVQGQKSELQRTHKRVVVVTSHIHAPEAQLEGFYVRTLQALGDGIHDEDGHYCRLTIGEVAWYEPKKVVERVSGVAFELSFEGGAYVTQAVPQMTIEAVEPGARL